MSSGSPKKLPINRRSDYRFRSIRVPTIACKPYRVDSRVLNDGCHSVYIPTRRKLTYEEPNLPFCTLSSHSDSISAVAVSDNEHLFLLQDPLKTETFGSSEPLHINTPRVSQGESSPTEVFG